MTARIAEFQPQVRTIQVTLRRLSEIEAEVKAQYEGMGL